MTKSFVSLLFTLVVSTIAVSAQTKPTPLPSKTGPDRVVVTSSIPPARTIKSPIPAAAATPIPSVKLPVAAPVVVATEASNLNYKGLSFSQIKNKIAEAKRLMQSRPITTALTSDTNKLVRIAYYDWQTKKVEYLVETKDAFLTPNVLTGAMSSSGKAMTIRTLRANGVNTPVLITDDAGKAQLPLIVQYPVEREGRFVETAYYMSTHPGIVTPEVVSAGRFYVHNVIEIARDQLRVKGYAIQPQIADIAERLATVEHVDHLRFKTEFQPNIYNDIFTLYALNEGQTFRYSVSSAGAGGMVQMIPSTYRMIREHYPNAALMPDFVEGMRNHVNATQAMLLYMQMTWNDLSASPTIQSAVQTGIATQPKLMAAGYNSNPAKLAGYISRGGAGWTSLIPRETQMYLQIYSSLESAVAMPARKQ